MILSIVPICVYSCVYIELGLLAFTKCNYKYCKWSMRKYSYLLYWRRLVSYSSVDSRVPDRCCSKQGQKFWNVWAHKEYSVRIRDCYNRVYAKLTTWSSQCDGLANSQSMYVLSHHCRRNVLIQVDFTIFCRQYISSYTMCICCSHIYMCIYTYSIHTNGAFQFVHAYLVMFHLFWFHCLHVDYYKRFVFFRIVTRIPFNGCKLCYCRQSPSRAYR